MPRESGIEGYLVDEIKARGGKALKLTGYKGIPDRLPLLNGVMCFAETKTNTNLETAQRVWRGNLIRMGFKVWVPRTRADVRELLEWMATQ